MKTIDFSRSYIRFRIDLKEQPAITLSHRPPTTLNEVRINIECRCALTHRKTGKETIYALGASCKTERVGTDKDIWLQPNADFCLTASNEEFLVMKSWQKNDIGVKRFPETLGVQPERQTGLVKEAWVKFAIDLKPVEGRVLENVDQIIASTMGEKPQVSHTEFDQGDYHVVIDHPVKTMNTSDREQVFQTDTGPILLPDLSPERLKKAERLVEVFDLAYSAFNAPTWAEFVVNVRTPIADGISVNHYSQSRRIENTKNYIVEVQ